MFRMFGRDRPRHSPSLGGSDMPRDNWVDRRLPALARPFARLMRLDRLIGAWLLLLPGWWALALAAPPGRIPDPAWVALFAIGAVLMRAAGCIVNDLFDREFDARVARTADRPLASGEISVRAALMLLSVLLILSLAILLQFNATAIALGFFSLLLIVPYPLMKRITWWPQAWLGLTFSWGVPLGWAVVRGTLEPTAFVLYAATFFWIMGYDTIYAHQDKEDDALVGVKSTARLFGKYSRPLIGLFYAICIVLMGYAGRMEELAWPFWVGLVIAAGYLLRQTLHVDFENPLDCLFRFRRNRDFGLIMFFAFIAGRVFDY